MRQYLFDNAVVTFGRSLEAALDGVKGKNEKAVSAKRARILDQWLDRPLKYRSVSGPTNAGPTSGDDEKAATDVQQSFTVIGLEGA